MKHENFEYRILNVEVQGKAKTNPFMIRNSMFDIHYSF